MYVNGPQVVICVLVLCYTYFIVVVVVFHHI